MSGHRLSRGLLVAALVALGTAGCSWIIGVSEDPTVTEVPDANDAAVIPDPREASTLDVAPPDAAEDAPEDATDDGAADGA